MLKKTFLLLASGLIIAACSATQSEDVAPPVAKENSAGPYDVTFDPTTGIFQHNFEMNIAQSEGKVDYYIQTPEEIDVTFVETALKVTGCPASQVTHQTFWLPDSATTSGQYLGVGSVFRTRAGIRGSFMHVLRGLDGCATVNLTTKLQKRMGSNMPCKESTDTTCRVQVYCKETDPVRTYVEVEVWKESWGVTLRKFMNSGNGTRSLMATNTVVSTSTTTETTYSANSPGDRTYLRFNNQTFAGVYSQDVMGNAYPTDVTCKLP